MVLRSVKVKVRHYIFRGNIITAKATVSLLPLAKEANRVDKPSLYILCFYIIN